MEAITLDTLGGCSRIVVVEVFGEGTYGIACVGDEASVANVFR